MRKIVLMFWKSFLILTGCLTIIFFQGCGLIAVLGTESPSKQKTPAEIRLIKDKEKDKTKKLLVLVKQPSYLNAPPLLGQVLTEQIQARLIANAALSQSNLIGGDTLAQFRSSTPNFYSMTPQEIGKALKADWVLIADLTAYKLVNVANTEYYSGSLIGRAFLIDIADSRQIWPADSGDKKIDVGFDVERKGSQAALIRLAAAYAHCATRYFYDCPVSKFKIADDKSALVWSQWGD